MSAATNVVEALAAVQAEIGGIAKRTSAERGRSSGDAGVSYAYRGIDEIAAAAQPLLGKHGIVIVPSVVSRDTTEIVVNNKPWTDTIVLVEWGIYGPNGSSITARTEGWGRDNSDKGINKAMTGAYKNLLLRLLTIGDPGDDTDGATHERDSRRRPPVDDPGLAESVALFERLKEVAGTSTAERLKAFAVDHGHTLTIPEFNAHPDWRAAVAARLDQPAEPAEPAEPDSAGSAEPVPDTLLGFVTDSVTGESTAVYDDEFDDEEVDDG
jgi:hypothetical protein